MSYYALSALTNLVTSLLLALLVLTQSKGASPVSRSFCLFAAAVAGWSAAYFGWQTSLTADTALFHCNVLSAFAAFIPATFFHFIVRITRARGLGLWVTAGYVLALIFGVMIPMGLMIQGVEPRGGFEHWPIPTKAYHFFVAYFAAATIAAHIMMIRAHRSATSHKIKRQLQYVFAGTLIGFIGGSTNYPLWYNMPIRPFGNILVSLYVVTIAYSIVKYQLMDIKVVAAKAFVFAVVYVPVLAAPFVIAAKFKTDLETALGNEWWAVPLILANVMTPAGIYIYLRLKRKAEAFVLYEQRRYQATLLQVSQGMTLIKELGRLLNLIVHVTARAMHLKDVSLYLLDKESASYTMRAVRYRSRAPINASMRVEDPIVLYMMRHRAPLVADDVKAKLSEIKIDKVDDLLALEKRLKELKASVVVPSFVHEVLVGFLVMGDKTNGHMYTQDDLNVLGVLANQSALAVENAIFYEERGKSLAEQFHDEKLKSLGKMGSDMSHQVNNRLNIISSAAGACAHVYLPLLKEEFVAAGSQSKPSKALDLIDRELRKIEDNAIRGGEIAQTIMRFAKKTADIKLVPVDILEAVKGAQLLLSSRFEQDGVRFVVDIPSELPKALSNLALLEDILMNLLSNARDAHRIKTERVKDGLPKFECSSGPFIAVRARMHAKDQTLLMEIEDNGIGMTKEQLEQIFVPFFTTKATTVKGTGLGLSIIRQMVDHLKGRIEARSEYGKGTIFTLTLPAVELQRGTRTD